MQKIDPRQLLSYERYCKYRRFAAERGYCDPFVPYVGPDYDDGCFPRVVYCGVSAWWSDHISAEGEGVRFYENAIRWALETVEQADTKSPFWRLMDAALERLDEARTFSPLERRRRIAWTNLSKLGVAGETAPPASDLELRALDVAQLGHELAVLNPAILLCVSGSKLEETGYAVFNDREWPRADFEPSVPKTEVRRSLTGGWLYWTMHPQFKSGEWQAKLLSDVARITRFLNS